MLRYVPVLAIIGVIFAVIFAAADKFVLAKIEDAKRRRLTKILLYGALYFTIGCIVAEVVG